MLHKIHLRPNHKIVKLEPIISPHDPPLDDNKHLLINIEIFKKHNLFVLKENVRREEDFHLLEWDGQEKDCILRQWVPELSDYELDPLVVQLVVITHVQQLEELEKQRSHWIMISRFITSSEFVSLVKSELLLNDTVKNDVKEIRLWNAMDEESSVIIDANELTLDDCCLVTNQKIIVEVKQKAWPLDDLLPRHSRTNSMDSGESLRKKRFSLRSLIRKVGEGFPPKMKRCDSSKKGMTGLVNLGNSCYMNAALQCLSGTSLLTDYILTDTFLGDINKDNPLGTQGKIVQAYASLLKEIWKGRQKIVPKQLKNVISAKSIQFSNYRQQDAHEFVSFLLDCLHEDLNKVKQKPYIEFKDSENQSDEELSQESWSYHLSRNQSVIVENFMGQLKSTLSCPSCGKVSVKFDPFLYLSVPVPQISTFLSVFFMNSDPNHPNFGKKPRKYLLKVAPGYRIGLLKRKFGELVSLQPSSFRFYDLSGRHLRLLHDTDQVNALKSGDKIFCFWEPKDSMMMVQFVQRLVIDDTTILPSCPGFPFIVPLPESTNHAKVRSIISQYCSRFTQEGAKSEFTIRKYNLLGILEKFEETWTDKDILTVDWTSSEDIDQNEAKTVVVDIEAFEEYRKHKEQCVHILDCIKLFSETEQLNEGNMWHCKQCKDDMQAYKRVELWTLPEILIIHIKRFVFDEHSRHKLDTFIDYPVNSLDLSSCLSKKIQTEDNNYELYGVILHAGDLNSGHYIALVRHVGDGKWRQFNDSYVADILDKDVVSKDAYILFYRRKRRKVINLKTPNSPKTPTKRPDFV